MSVLPSNQVHYFESADAIAAEAKNFCGEVSTITPVINAVKHAMQLSEGHGSICVAGSFTTVGEVDRGYFSPNPSA